MPNTERWNRLPVLSEQMLERDFKRFNDQLVDTKRPVHRIAADALNQFTVSSDNYTLRSAKQLIAAERYNIDACRQTIGNYRLINSVRVQIYETSAAEVFVYGMPCALPSRVRSRNSGRAVNPVTRKFEGCTRKMRPVFSLSASL